MTGIQTQDDTGLNTVLQSTLAAPFGPTCPSELMLDRLQLGELGRSAGRRVTEHLASCAACRQRVTRRRQWFSSLENDAGALVLRGIETGLANSTLAAERTKSSLRYKLWRNLRQPQLWIGLAAAATVAVLALVWAPGMFPADRTPVAAEQVQIKGTGLGLRVFRERRGTVVELQDGERVQRGDRLRFRINLGTPGEVMIVGVENDSSLYACFPSTSAAAKSEKRHSGDNGLLPGAIALDDSTGAESLHLVSCKLPFTLADLEFSSKRKRLQAPDGCRVTSFRINKVLPQR